MNDPSQLTVLEGFLVGALVSLMAWEGWRAWTSRQWVSLFRPTLILAVILIYYCLLGPLIGLSQGGWFDRGINLRSAMVWAWGGAFVFYLSVLIGFYELPTPSFRRRLIPTIQPELPYRLGSALCWLGLGMFALVSGVRVIALLNPLIAAQLLEDGLGEGGVDVGAFANYFTYAVNFLIPGTALIWVSWILQRRHSTALLLWTLAAAGIYTSLGFRYRLVLLAVPFILLWYITRQRRPKVAIVAFGAAALIAVAGVVGLTRSYGSGLDLTALEGITTEEVVEAGLQESSVFLTTAGVMQVTPDRYPFVGARPMIATLLFPIPRALYPDKQQAEYLTDATAVVYGSKALATGSAILNFAEYYLIAGWPSLIAMSLLLGWLLRCLWNWFLVRYQEPFAQVLYVLSATYLYVVVSRGYLPQVVMLFVFSVAPLFWFYGRLARPVTFASTAAGQPPQAPSSPGHP
ncbi:hypothetical protein FQK07_14550 [Synechococcus sp. BSF8S]|uniref:hypothetical protein n=1 Tax=Synechococcales TaxID=1890424 RepID=UPI001627883E|nr:MULTISPECIES: hypothetical protein [unclassified Synechococcus]MBC1262446.1 hypothetical protein [Synechococcus sp. BSF8S]MBC1265404.1 hypothetical protein [Synechococcus sp. BSA11S]